MDRQKFIGSGGLDFIGRNMVWFAVGKSYGVVSANHFVSTGKSWWPQNCQELRQPKIKSKVTKPFTAEKTAPAHTCA